MSTTQNTWLSGPSKLFLPALAAGLLLSASSAPAFAALSCEPEMVIVARGSSSVVHYAARELQSYARKLFGAEWRIRTDLPSGEAAHSVIVLTSEQAPGTVAGLREQDRFEWIPSRSGVEIRATNDRSVLYGVYELARSWGVRFHLSGDVLPETARCELPSEPVSRQASLKLRGAHPYPNFLAGPSSWDEAQYEAYIRQLPKLGLNFIGFHQYTYEPYVDYSVDGQFPQTGHLETSSTNEWGYGTRPPCQFEVGRDLFDGCEWGSSTALESHGLSARERYRRAEELMARALKLAHNVGLVTAFGFEPLSHDPEFAELAKSADGLLKVTRARIDGVLRAFPELDYLWLFADESDQADRDRLVSTYRLMSQAERYLKRQAPEKSLMLGGWNVEASLRQFDRGTGSVHFGEDAVFTSYGNYDPWRTVQENREALFQGLSHDHSLAAWCEYDGRLLAGLQPNVTAYRKHLEQMKDSASLGFFFLHWNTRLCDSNLEYLAQAGWQEAAGAPGDFYRSYYGDRFSVDSAEAAEAALRLERINQDFAYAPLSFWLMADDWTYLGPWKRLADAVALYQARKPLPETELQHFRDQVAHARSLQPKLAELERVVAAFDRMAMACKTDCEHARFLANRVRYFAAYLASYVRLSLGIESFLGASQTRSSSQFRAFAASLDVDAWLSAFRLYTRFIDDRGEKGIVVSLNQKVLAGLRELEKAIQSPSPEPEAR